MRAILKNSWIIWSPHLYFNFKTFKDPNSSSFIRFQFVLYDSEEFLSYFWNFYKLKRWDLISGGKQFCIEPELFVSPIYISIFQSFIDQNSSSFVRFQWILHDSGVLFSESSNFYRLKRRDLISGGNQFCRKSELFVPPIYTSILKVL